HLAHRLARPERRLLRLDGHPGDGLDGDGTALDVADLFLSRLRDIAGQRGRLLRDLTDLTEALAGLDGDLVALLDLSRPLLHGHHRLLRLGLNRFDQHDDVLGGLARALGELADLLGYDREAQPSLAGAGGLDRRVERQEVRLRRDVLDGVDDLGDLQRAVSKALHLLRDSLNLAADALHAGEARPPPAPPLLTHPPGQAA